MDQPTLRAATAGDRDARARLLRDLQDPWFRICLSLLRDRDLAMEATQESAARLLRDLPRFRGESAFRTWAVGIAVNVCREVRRGRGRQDRGWRREDSEGPVWDLERAEERSAVREALHGLSDRQREAVVLRYFEEMTVDEAAKSMNCSTGTVKATVFQALRALRRRLTKLSLM